MTLTDQKATSRPNVTQETAGENAGHPAAPGPTPEPITSALKDKEATPPAGDAVPTPAEAAEEHAAAATLEKVEESREKPNGDIIDADLPQPVTVDQDVTDGHSKPGELEAEAADEAAAPEAGVPPSQPHPHPDREPDGAEPSDLDSEPSDALKPPTVQYTEPELLPTSDDGQVSPIEQDYGDTSDEEDYDDSFVATYMSNLDTKGQSKNGPPEPAGLESTRFKESYNLEDEDSHFFFHLVVLAFLVAIIYITYHNKRKVRSDGQQSGAADAFVFILNFHLGLLLLFRYFSWSRADAGKRGCAPGTRWSTTAWTRMSTRPCRP